MGLSSVSHWLIVLLIVVLVFGTAKLRNIGRDLGGAVHDFKEGLNQGSENKDAPAEKPQKKPKAANRPTAAKQPEKPMFDFSFNEMLVAGAVALVVLGPERLPKVARTAGRLGGQNPQHGRPALKEEPDAPG